MYFSVAKIVSAFMALNMVAANLHDSCACRNGDSDNTRLTTLACTAYNEASYEWGSTTYDAASGRCVQATTEDQIAGKEWQAACQKIASSGFDCADGEGKCYASPDEVSGSC
ncbi:hypothetical protein BGZ61DRAFT_532502 [Ilyonectria robusta]|uniref:uncharacterized protein n=1 Tax=Ilyonectria robusta TaxID=1079257 RepID=UPI001E8E54D0|nr:uncharacterized protein BGZ61DRAFT_532502 [Ilyonectria robusta]KAH8694417.1 hypothetical protein BGZ61DRAFT_532502 [Ilyonectria robusta]